MSQKLCGAGCPALAATKKKKHAQRGQGSGLDNYDPLVFGNGGHYYYRSCPMPTKRELYRAIQLLGGRDEREIVRGRLPCTRRNKEEEARTQWTRQRFG